MNAPSLFMLAVSVPLLAAFVCRLGTSPSKRFFSLSVQASAALMCAAGYAAITALHAPPEPWTWGAVCLGWFWVLATWPVNPQTVNQER